MQTLKKLAVATILTLSLAGLAVGATAAFTPSATLIADSSNQRGDLDAG